jgi:uncharacterized repeat protein (TIGR03803 family)
MKHNRNILLMSAIFVLLAATAVSAQTYTVLYNFGSGATCVPVSPQLTGVIAQGRNGDMYSTALGSCTSSFGDAYKITTKGKVGVLHGFSGSEQVLTVSGLTLATTGSYWGTNEGGEFGPGNIFKMSAAGKVTDYNVLGGTGEVNGDDPIAPPVQGMDGNFYGTTTSGGNTSKCTYGNGGCGVIYQITPAGKYKVIYTFDQTNGGNPDDALLLGTDGNFYGTASQGGTVGGKYVGDGVVFKITTTGEYSVVYAFCSETHCNDGANPLAALIQGSDGNFYGTTEYGGVGAGGVPEGVIFKLTPSGEITVLYSFCAVASCKDGANPFGSLVQATDGNFYGTTAYGGANGHGVIFEVTPAGKYTVLYNFATTTGGVPQTTLLQNTNGIFYGTASQGGTGSHIDCTGGCGVFYSFNVGLDPFVSIVNWYGKVGKTVEILGQGFKGTTAVSFNGTPAAFKATAANYLTAVVPAGATSGVITVTTPTGTLTSNRAFEVLP